jgi:hypothetical protein
VEASDNHNSIFLNLEEYSVGEAPHSGTATVPVDDRELQWMFGYCLNCCFYCQGETLPKLRAYVVVPCPRFQQILIGLWYPDDRERHGFLNRPALTCSQEMTSEGFCSCRARRESSSVRCASVSDSASASRLSHATSNSSAFSAAERLSI